MQCLLKRFFVVGSNQCDDQDVVWLEMNDDSQMSHLRQILLSLDISSLQKTQIIKGTKIIIANCIITTR